MDFAYPPVSMLAEVFCKIREVLESPDVPYPSAGHVYALFLASRAVVPLLPPLPDMTASYRCSLGMWAVVVSGPCCVSLMPLWL